MYTLKNLNILHKARLFLAIVLLCASTISITSNKAHAFAAVVDNPTANLIMEKINNNFLTQIAKITTQIAVLESQLEQAKSMANSLADGEVSTEMIRFAFDQAEKCGFTPPSIPFPNFPDLNLPKLCDGKNSFEALRDKVAKKFSYKQGMGIEEQAKITANRRVLHKDSTEYGLTLGASSRTLDPSKKKKDWTEQMGQSQSLVNQAHINNSILISIYSELVELRRINGALLELLSITYGSDTTQYYDEQGRIK